MATKESKLRSDFFTYLFGNEEGYICIATGTPRKGSKDKFEQAFFRWPTQIEELSVFIDGCKQKNIWFGINLLTKPERIKENCKPTQLVWADLDTCDPEILSIPPQVVVETSTDRYQSMWKLDEVIPASLAEEYSRRIYTNYKEKGVDSGWALTKLLRVPFTRNFKYASNPPVNLIAAVDGLTSVSDFESLVIDELKTINDGEAELPDLIDLPSADMVIYSYRHELKNNPTFKNAFFEEPEGDWSTALWSVINTCFEAGMSREEALAVAIEAKCNKYERDQRPLRHLWLDVVKASNANKAYLAIVGDVEDEVLNFPVLVTEDEMEIIEPSFINQYVDWASSITDASKEYHELSGMILLSSMLADKIVLYTAASRVIPNLWGLVLGESTLTRKTTAMDMAMDFVMEHDPSMILATMDSSVEGMFTALQERSEKVSIYYRDEVAGFFDAMAHKSYLAGMPETLTKLYDNPAVMTRQLRKETITVTRPVFIFFGGGILERVHQCITQEFFFSGFMPRFLVVNGEADLSNLQWIGPAARKNSHNPREFLKNTLFDIVEKYKARTIKQKILGQEADITKEIEVELTDEAWAKMQEIEQTLVIAANSSNLSLVALPTYTRLSTSLLKISMLIAASRQDPEDFKVVVELKDIVHAASFIQRWAAYSVELMTNVGKTSTEVELQKVLKYVKQKPGLTKAEHMRRFRLHAINAKMIFQTLEERGQIRATQSGRGYKIYPT